ncbi:MAG: ester cyclase [Crocosphaera sp.]
MSLKDNKAVVSQFIEEIFNKRSLAAIDTLVSAEAIDHYKQGLTLSLLMTAFPDFQVKIKTMIAEGDKVTVVSTLTGTHRGKLMGIEPTNKAISVIKTDIYRVMDGKIVESWQNGDYMGMMQQIGLVDSQRLIYHLQVKSKMEGLNLKNAPVKELISVNIKQ